MEAEICLVDDRAMRMIFLSPSFCLIVCFFAIGLFQAMRWSQPIHPIQGRVKAHLLERAAVE